MTIASPSKHNITVTEKDNDMRELSCTCGWAPKNLIELPFVVAIIDRHTMMNRGS